MTGKPVGVPIAHPVTFLGHGEEDVGATAVGVVDAPHPGVGDEDSRHLAVGDVSEQPVDAATPPAPAAARHAATRGSTGPPWPRPSRNGRDPGRR
ncbi:hypothetical protein, partial [Streptomyces sp. NPDC057052]|uniref:hypothetical protein n=1 Tax=Streptomyces sp. NPDC057052 TaxID=3346010 RepID=UPI0036252705